MRGVLLGLALLTLAGASEAADEGAVGEIRQRGHLRVCADPSNPPYSSTEPVTPGFEVELARLVARELGVEAQFSWSPTYVRALKPLRDGSCDLFMGLPVDERFRDGNPWIAVSRPYYVMSHAIVARVDATIPSLADLAGQRVAIEGASVADLFIAERAPDRKIYRRQEQAFDAVVSGEAPVALLWLPVASWLGRGRPEVRVVPVREPKLEFPVGAGVRRRDRGLDAAVDAAIARLQDSGKVREILLRYGAVAIIDPGRRGVRSSPPPRLATTLVQAGATAATSNRTPIDNGRSIFSTACSRCHGAEGVGGGTGGAIPPIRNYDGGWDKFFRLVREGRKNTAMAGFKGILTDDEIRNVFTYLTSLQK